MKGKKELLKRLAFLEFVHDQLTTEIQDLDHLFREIGFPDGVASAKWIAGEMIQAQKEEPKEQN